MDHTIQSPSGAQISIASAAFYYISHLCNYIVWYNGFTLCSANVMTILDGSNFASFEYHLFDKKDLGKRKIETNSKS